MKKWIIFAVVVCIAYGAYYFAREQDRKVDGFYPNRITSIFPDDPKWDIDVSHAEVDAAIGILNQPYHYLAHGFQCYAFVSADDKYVLKFIRQQRLKPPVVIEWLPNILFFKSFKEQRVQMGQKRANYLFRSLKVSFEDVPEETGMLLVHLNKTKNLYPTVQLIDKAGNRYSVKLDDYEFVLQKKALPIKPTISKLMAEGDVAGAKVRVDQIFDLLVTCAKKGIADMDNQLIRKNNLGFLPDRAIYIDTGKITRKESMKTLERFRKDLERLQPLYLWLQEHYPELAEHFLAYQERVLANF